MIGDSGNGEQYVGKSFGKGSPMTHGGITDGKPATSGGKNTTQSGNIGGIGKGYGQAHLQVQVPGIADKSGDSQVCTPMAPWQTLEVPATSWHTSSPAFVPADLLHSADEIGLPASVSASGEKPDVDFELPWLDGWKVHAKNFRH